jgi:hypothetical protein
MMGVLVFIAGALVLCVIVGLPVMYLWNWLIPDLFGIREIRFWEAVGLTLLFEFMLPGSGGGPSGKK